MATRAVDVEGQEQGKEAEERQEECFDFFEVDAGGGKQDPDDQGFLSQKTEANMVKFIMDSMVRKQ